MVAYADCNCTASFSGPDNFDSEKCISTFYIYYFLVNEKSAFQCCYFFNFI